MRIRRLQAFKRRRGVLCLGRVRVSRLQWLAVARLLVVVFLGALFAEGAKADPPILTVTLIGRVYDVYNMPGQLQGIRALNNGQAFGNTWVADAVGQFSAGDAYSHAAVFSPQGGFSYLHTNVNNFQNTYVEDIGDANVAIGWDEISGGGSSAFVYDVTNRVRYLTNVFPQVQALDQSLGGNKLKGLRINRRGEMILLSSGGNGNPPGYYKVSTNGAVTQLVLAANGSQFPDLNNNGQEPPDGPNDTVNVAINDYGDYAGYAIDHSSTNAEQTGSLYATRNGLPLPNSAGARPTSINKSGYVAATPGTVWSPNDTRTYLPAAMVAQDTNHVLTQFYTPPYYTNTSYPTFINDGLNIIVGGYYLEPLCPEASIGSIGGAGFEVINGFYSVLVGNHFKATAVIYNDSKAPLRNISVALDPPPPPNLFRQVGFPSPPVPTSLAGKQNASSEFEWEVLDSGSYTGRFVLHATGDCGPVYAEVMQPVLTRIVNFVKTPLGAQIDANPRMIGLSNIIEVRTIAKNNTTTQMTNVRLSAPLTLVGTGGARLTNGPSPVNYATLNGGDSVVFTNLYFTTNYGRVTFNGKLLAQMGANSLTSNPAISPSISIQAKGDLHIKRASESATQFGIDNEYQSNPAGTQVRTNIVGLTELSEFHVRIQNDEPDPQTFILKIREENDPGWNLKYLFNDTDISATLRATGVTFPQLASNATHTVIVQMAPTNAVPDDPMRVLLQLQYPSVPNEILDTVEAVTHVANDIIVNSTGDQPDADLTDGVPDVNTNAPGLQTTLRCAIDFANRREGADKIKFDIKPTGNVFEDGVPTILPLTALPDVTNTLIIDGWSQSTNSQRPPVQLRGKNIMRPNGARDEQKRIDGLYGTYHNTNFPPYLSFLLDWPGAANGLHLVAPGCEVRGMVINHFPLCGILVDGSECVIQGNYIGVDPSGNIPRGSGLGPTLDPTVIPWLRGAQLALRSGLNLIGGAEAKLGNVISGREGTYWAFEGAFVPETGEAKQITTALFPPLVFVSGSNAIGNRIIGNTIGPNADGDSLPKLPDSEPDQPSLGSVGGILLYLSSHTVIGGSLPGEGNLVAGNEIEIMADDGAVQGNVIGGDRQRTRTLRAFGGHPGGTIFLSETSKVGGLASGEGNIILAGGIEVLGATNGLVQGNWIGATPDGRFFPENGRGIHVLGSTGCLIEGNFVSGRTIGILSGLGRMNRFQANHIVGNLEQGVVMSGETDSLLTLNVITNNGRNSRYPSGVVICNFPGDVPSLRVQVSTNEIYSNHGLGISLLNASIEEAHTPVLPLANDVGDSDTGPNTMLNYPTLNSAVQNSTNNQLRIRGGFGSVSGVHSYHIQFFRNTRKGAFKNGEGQAFLAATTIQTIAVGQAIIDFTTPASDVVGQWVTATITDEVGNTSEFSERIFIQSSLATEGDGMSDPIENRVANRIPGGLAGDGNGDGVPDAQQANVTSFPVVDENWLTLVAPASVTFSNVQSAVSEPAMPPDGFSLPYGWVSFTLNGLTPGATVTVTNILHGSQSVSNVFAYGPTPGQPQPHWYQLNFTQSGDELRLSFTDGSAGDYDLSISGNITTLYAPAVPKPPLPQLSLLSVSSSMAAIFGISTNATFATNIVRICALAWPATATNYVIESTTNLSPASWSLVTGTAVIIGDKLVVTNVSTTPMRYYRLRPGVLAFTQMPAPTLQIQRTGTNTFLLFWPSSFTGFTLQQNTNVVAGTWTSVTNLVSATDGLNQVVVPPTTGSRFFRLKSQ